MSELLDGMEGASFKEIVMIQLKNVTTLGNVEFRGGYYTIQETKQGTEKEVYVQDTREVFGNAVHTLAYLLRPKFDDKMTKAWNNFNKKMKVIKNEFIEKSTPDEEVILGESFYEDPKDKILLETYKMKKLRLHQNLFSAVSKQLARINYFEMIGGTYE